MKNMLCYYELHEETVSKSNTPLILMMGFAIFSMFIFFTSFLPPLNDYHGMDGPSPLFVLMGVIMLLTIPLVMIFFVIHRIYDVSPKTISEARTNKEDFY